MAWKKIPKEQIKEGDLICYGGFYATRLRHINIEPDCYFVDEDD